MSACPFLSGLAGLPLVGGSVALIGRTTAAAVPVTTALLESYRDWLAVELGETLCELAPRYQPEHAALASRFRREWCRETYVLNPDFGPDRFATPPTVPPSTRAAVVLSAAGVLLVGGRHGRRGFQPLRQRDKAMHDAQDVFLVLSLVLSNTDLPVEGRFREALGTLARLGEDCARSTLLGLGKMHGERRHG